MSACVQIFRTPFGLYNQVAAKLWTVKVGNPSYIRASWPSVVGFRPPRTPPLTAWKGAPVRERTSGATTTSKSSLSHPSPLESGWFSVTLTVGWGGLNATTDHDTHWGSTERVGRAARCHLGLYSSRVGAETHWHVRIRSRTPPWGRAHRTGPRPQCETHGPRGTGSRTPRVKLKLGMRRA